MAEAAAPLELEKPTPLELVAGFFMGHEPVAVTLEDKLAEIGPGASPRSMFEQIVLRGLQRPPCVVGFSGGRDSSAVLAVAVHVARREGLPLPVAFTERYPASPSTQEDDWQEQVISHLGLADWERVELSTEFDAVGALAQEFMRENGVTLGHLQKSDVIFGRARGGSYMDGEGGDEVLGFRRAMAVRRLLGHPQSLGRPRTWRWLAFHLASRVRREQNWQRYHGERLEARRWLQPETFAQVLAAIAVESAADPFDARQSQWLHLHKRRVATFRRNRQTIARHRHDTAYLQPFLEPEFVAAWARSGGLLGLSDRTAAMRVLFSDLLPEAVIGRTSKAVFNTVFLGACTQEFARRWSGAGVDESAVDTAMLRQEWLSEWPSNLTSGLLQSAWLADNPSAARRA